MGSRPWFPFLFLALAASCDPARVSSPGNGGTGGGGAGGAGAAGRWRAGRQRWGLLRAAGRGRGNGAAVDAAGSNQRCAEEAHQAEIVPLDLMMLVDASASMTDSAGMGSKWEAAQSALSAFVRDPRSAGLGVGLQFYPGGRERTCMNDTDCGCDEGRHLLLPAPPGLHRRRRTDRGPLLRGAQQRRPARPAPPAPTSDAARPAAPTARASGRRARREGACARAAERSCRDHLSLHQLRRARVRGTGRADRRPARERGAPHPHRAQQDPHGLDADGAGRARRAHPAAGPPGGQPRPQGRAGPGGRRPARWLRHERHPQPSPPT